jgi:hypothetical protein
MWNAIAFQVVAFCAFVLFFAVFYLTGLLLQSLNKSEASKAGQMLLVLLSMGWLGSAMFLIERF